MKNMTLKAITAACSGTYFGPEDALNQEVTGVAIDSRKIEKGYLFAAVRGERVDGHTFIPKVMETGALCSISEEKLEDADYPYILVESSLQAIKDIAEYYRQELDIKVVGITGSVGKTSTKEMVASVLSQKYNVLKTDGNFNNEIGVPLTIFNIREEHEVAVLEMGMNHFGEMTRLAKMARPDISVITNIGVAHLENLGSRDGILKAKTEMFPFVNPNGSIILNGEDDKLSTIEKYENIIPVFFGLSDDKQVYADNIVNLGLKGTSCDIHVGGEIVSAVIPIPGSHMVLNALAGAAIGHALGLTAAEIKAGIEALVPVAGRNNIIEKEHVTVIDDCYNANPVSMKASLDVLNYANTRKVAILGDMGELGENEIQMHYEVGQYAAEKGIDLVICIGELCRHMYDGADAVKNWNGRAVHFASKADFLAEMGNIIETGDTVLVKASHFMAFPEIVEKL